MKPTRVRRRFELSATVGDVLDFIESCEECPSQYTAYTTFPKKELSKLTSKDSVSKWGISSNCVVDVEPV